MRLLLSRLLEAQRPHLFLIHDPHCGLSVPNEQIFESIEQWSECQTIPRLSVFRGIDDVDDLARLACRVKDCTLILDELDRAAINKKWSSLWVKRIVMEGRHYRVNLWGTFRLTANVPEDFISQCHKIFFFHTPKTALYELRGLVLRVGEQYADILPTLKVGEFVVFEDNF